MRMLLVILLCVASLACHSARGNVVATPSPSPVPIEQQQVYTCAGVTKKGERCKRHVKHPGDYCWQHKSQKH